MIAIGLGANLPSSFGAPVATLERALTVLAEGGERVVARSSWYETAPVPASDQPWYINGVALLQSSRSPDQLLHRLHEIEADFGRVRTVINEARLLDLDLLDYDARISAAWPILPHPRLHQRGFVLQPLAEVAPGWRHPVSGETVHQLIERIDPKLITRRYNILG